MSQQQPAGFGQPPGFAPRPPPLDPNAGQVAAPAGIPAAHVQAIGVVRAGQPVSTGTLPPGAVSPALPPTPPTPPNAPADSLLRQLNDLKFRYEELIDKYRKLTAERDALTKQVAFYKMQEESEKIKFLQGERDKLVAALKQLQDHFNLLFKQDTTLRAERNKINEELEAALRGFEFSERNWSEEIVQIEEQRHPPSFPIVSDDIRRVC